MLSCNGVIKIDWIYMGLTLLVPKEEEHAWLAGIMFQFIFFHGSCYLSFQITQFLLYYVFVRELPK
jgi:hypothetical protein